MKTALTCLVVCLVALSCTKNSISEEIANPGFDPLAASAYVGEFYLELNHQKFEPTYDDAGNLTGYGNINYPIRDTLSIQPVDGEPGAYEINTVIKGWRKLSVIGTMRSDTLYFEDDSSNSIRNDMVKGYFWKTGTYLFVNYKWDTSDTWSSSAVPEYGYVKGLGQELD